MDLILSAIIMYFVAKAVLKWMQRRLDRAFDLAQAELERGQHTTGLVVHRAVPEPYGWKTFPGHRDEVDLKTEELMLNYYGEEIPLPVLNAREHDYIPMPGEVLYGARKVLDYDWKEEGTLYITDQALVFQSKVWNKRFDWHAISAFMIGDGRADNFYIFRPRMGKPEVYLFATPNVEFAVAANLMVYQTAGICRVKRSHNLEVNSVQ